MPGIDRRFEDEDPDVSFSSLDKPKATVTQETTIGRTVIIGNGIVPFSGVQSALDAADPTDPAVAALRREAAQFQTSSRTSGSVEVVPPTTANVAAVRQIETIETNGVL